MNKFINIFKDNPVFANLSIDVIRNSETSLSLSVSDMTAQKNVLGVVNGSFALSLFDTAVGFFIVNKSNSLKMATIFNYNMNIFSPLKGDLFFIDIFQLSSGKTICTFQVDCYVMKGVSRFLLASGQVHAYISLKKSQT